MTNEQLRILTSTEDNVVDRTQGRIQSLSNFVGRTIPELDQAYETLKENLNNIESEINSERNTTYFCLLRGYLLLYVTNTRVKGITSMRKICILWNIQDYMPAQLF